MDERIRELIKGSEWFRDVPEAVIGELLGCVVRCELKADEVLIRRGDAGDSLFLLVEGWVKVVIEDQDGGEMVLNHVGPGELVGEMALIDRRPRSASVVALSELTVLELMRDDFLRLVDEHPVLALQMVITLSNRMRFVLKYVENAMQWSQKIAEGDYSFLEEFKDSEAIVDHSGSDDARANRFLAAFFEMAEEVQERELEMQSQLEQLSIQIDQVKRDRQIKKITETQFFEQLKADVDRLRRGRGE